MELLSGDMKTPKNIFHKININKSYLDQICYDYYSLNSPDAHAFVTYKIIISSLSLLFGMFFILAGKFLGFSLNQS